MKTKEIASVRERMIFVSIKPTARDSKSNHTKQALLDSAIALFLKYGVNKVTIDNISAECGLSKGAFYHFFTSKDHIVTLSVNSGLDKFIEKNFVLDSNTPVIDQLIGLNMSAFEYFKYIGKEMTRASYEGQVRSCIEVHILGRTYVDTLTALVRKGLEENAFRTSFNEDYTYMHCIAVFTGMLLKWCTQDDKMDAVLDWSKIIQEQFRIMSRNS
ncbi:MAG: TetR/AcrR family transcriptional regulator [Caulobacteraceae bacterium]